MTGALRALVVCYTFPPVGGAGVARVAKLVKYLPDHGISPTVLTVANPSVPVYDQAFARDVPPGIAVLRARTLEPGYRVKQAAWAAEGGAGGTAARLRRAALRLGRQALMPDPQVLWQPAAARALAARLLGPRPDDVVFVSGPPFSQFLLAPLARLQRRTAVVLDYRDEWTTYRAAYEMMGRLARASGAALEPVLLRAAHAVTCATEAFRQALLARFRWLDPARVQAIPNGYDPADFAFALAEPPSDRFVLTYAGTIFRLTSPRGLLGALRRLHAAEPVLAAPLEVRFFGRIVETEEAAFAGSEALGVRRLGYVDHDRALAEMAKSHLGLCLLDDVPGAERIYPAKIFELMALAARGRRALVLAPEGALAELCRRHRLGAVLPPRDEPAIAAALARELARFRDGGAAPAPGLPVDLERYDRRRLAGEFAEVFRQAVRRARGDDGNDGDATR